MEVSLCSFLFFILWFCLLYDDLYNTVYFEDCNKKLRVIILVKSVFELIRVLLSCNKKGLFYSEKVFGLSRSVRKTNMSLRANCFLWHKTSLFVFQKSRNYR